jgi:hypothetical protein
VQKVMRLLKKVTRGGIPSREQEDKSKEDEKVTASRKASTGIGVGAFAQDKNNGGMEVRILSEFKTPELEEAHNALRKAVDEARARKEPPDESEEVQDARDRIEELKEKYPERVWLVRSADKRIYKAPESQLVPSAGKRKKDPDLTSEEVSPDLHGRLEENRAKTAFRSKESRIVLHALEALEAAKAGEKAKAKGGYDPREHWYDEDADYQTEADRNNSVTRRELEFLRAARRLHDRYYRSEHTQKVPLPWLQSVFSQHGGIP